MTTLKEVIQALEEWAPPQWAESYDTVGLLWGELTRPVSGILTTLDITHDTIQEAQAIGANLIISHHPIWFGQKQRLSWDNFADRVIYGLIRADIAVYAMHTNLDHAKDGVSYILCRTLGLEPIAFLRSHDTYGAGYVGIGSTELPIESFLRHVQSTLKVPSLRYSRGKQVTIRKVAVCGGAGSFLLPEAIRAEADAFLTADIPYHRFFEAQGHLWLIDIGHYESEVWIADQIAHYLRRRFPNLSTFSTRIHTNPIEYWI
ncbi:MAG: Nif3-like dinuclear metal center hexameric protein [Bacteroidia bacterium]|nr:Nif3-like dinuclear metal center hexameric protein [Bacteroidia bacterium]MCX7652259.1 Nif3-like dinuclear metal center hexameric protein [Bacteroidia bacterium]MDW8416521.1 Nif3-like dinuclear metal center hexameric protein [Bacteroidia bacterium]